MSIIEEIYNEIMADLCAKGFSGLVSMIDHDYKNGCVSVAQQHLPPYDNTYTTLKTKNENPAGFYLLPAGSPSLKNFGGVCDD